MGKTNEISAVHVLRFFETGPIETAEVVFAIVTEKMRERLGGRRVSPPLPANETGGARARRQHSERAAAPGESASPESGA